MSSRLVRNVEISVETFERLQKRAEPLVDTIDTVIIRLLDDADRRFHAPPTRGMANRGEPYDPFSPPLLTHTRILAASVAGKKLENPNWNSLLVETIGLAAKAATSYDSFTKLVLANTCDGRKEEDGYRFYPEVGSGISIQGQDANGAWKSAVYTAMMLHFPIEAEFMWRLKEGVANAGRVGIFSYDP